MEYLLLYIAISSFIFLVIMETNSELLLPNSLKELTYANILMFILLLPMYLSMLSMLFIWLPFLILDKLHKIKVFKGTK